MKPLKAWLKYLLVAVVLCGAVGTVVLNSAHANSCSKGDC
jgi:hypothetical protein